MTVLPLSSTLHVVHRLCSLFLLVLPLSLYPFLSSREGLRIRRHFSCKSVTAVVDSSALLVDVCGSSLPPLPILCMAAGEEYPSALPFRPHEEAARARRLTSSEASLSPSSFSYTVPYHRLTYGFPMVTAKSTSDPTADRTAVSQPRTMRGASRRSAEVAAPPPLQRPKSPMPDCLLLHPSFAQFNEHGGRGGGEACAPVEGAPCRSSSLYDLLTIPVVGRVVAPSEEDTAAYRYPPASHWLLAASMEHDRGRGGARGHTVGREQSPANAGASRGEVYQASRAGRRDPLLEQLHGDWGLPRPRRPPRTVTAASRPAPDPSSGEDGRPLPRILRLFSQGGGAEGTKKRRKGNAKPAGRASKVFEAFRHDDGCACGGFRQDVGTAASAGRGDASAALTPFCLVRARVLDERGKARCSSQRTEWHDVGGGGGAATVSNSALSGGVIECACACHQDSWFQTRHCSRCDCFREGCSQQ